MYQCVPVSVREYQSMSVCTFVCKCLCLCYVIVSECEHILVCDWINMLIHISMYEYVNFFMCELVHIWFVNIDMCDHICFSEHKVCPTVWAFSCEWLWVYGSVCKCTSMIICEKHVSMLMWKCKSIAQVCINECVNTWVCSCEWMWACLRVTWCVFICVEVILCVNV